MKHIVVYGAGGLGRETAGLIKRINATRPTYAFDGYIVADEYIQQAQMSSKGVQVHSEDWLLANSNNVCCTCAIGDGNVRMALQERLKAQGVEFETLIDPTAYIDESSVIGLGCIIGAQVSVSVDCEVGNGVLLNGRITLGHDVKVGDYSSIMPWTGVSGRTIIGENVTIGGNSFIVPDRRIGPGATIAAGSTVFSNVKAGTTVLGNPARRHRELETS